MKTCYFVKNTKSQEADLPISFYERRDSSYKSLKKPVRNLNCPNLLGNVNRETNGNGPLNLQQ